MCIIGSLIQGVEPLKAFFVVRLIAGIAEIVQFTAFPGRKSAFDLDGCFFQLLRCENLRGSVIDVDAGLVYCSEPAFQSDAGIHDLFCSVDVIHIADMPGLIAVAGDVLFAISTYNTDYILTKEENFEKALTVLAGESSVSV